MKLVSPSQRGTTWQCRCWGIPAPAFAPNIVVNVYGDASEEAVDNMRESLRDTVRELYDEFREEELQQMSLKNQYSF